MVVRGEEPGAIHVPKMDTALIMESRVLFILYRLGASIYRELVHLSNFGEFRCLG